MGHELTHGFDDQGAQYDGRGNLVNWGQPETEQHFQQRTPLRRRTSTPPTSHRRNPPQRRPTPSVRTSRHRRRQSLAVAAYSACGPSPRTVIADGFTEDQSSSSAWARPGAPRPARLRAPPRHDRRPRPPAGASTAPSAASPDFGRAFRCKGASKMAPRKAVVSYGSGNSPSRVATADSGRRTCVFYFCAYPADDILDRSGSSAGSTPRRTQPGRRGNRRRRRGRLFISKIEATDAAFQPQLLRAKHHDQELLRDRRQSAPIPHGPAVHRRAPPLRTPSSRSPNVGNLTEPGGQVPHHRRPAPPRRASTSSAAPPRGRRHHPRPLRHLRRQERRLRHRDVRHHQPPPPPAQQEPPRRPLREGLLAAPDKKFARPRRRPALPRRDSPLRYKINRSAAAATASGSSRPSCSTSPPLGRPRLEEDPEARQRPAPKPSATTRSSATSSAPPSAPGGDAWGNDSFMVHQARHPQGPCSASAPTSPPSTAAQDDRVKRWARPLAPWSDLDRGRAIPQTPIDVASLREQHATGNAKLSEELGPSRPTCPGRDPCRSRCALARRTKPGSNGEPIRPRSASLAHTRSS